MAKQITSMQELLERIDHAAEDEDQVSIEMLMEAVGSRSFGPLLLLAGIVLFSPLSGIPGFPTTMALFVLLIAVQLLMQKDHFWLPQWILKRSVASSKIKKAVGAVQRPARFVDRWTGPRLTFLTEAAGVHLIAIFCIIVATGTPAMEVVPFSATLAGAALTVFGLSVIAHDGLLALIAAIFSALAVGFIAYYLFS